MKLIFGKILVLCTLLLSSLCYASVPTDAKFRAVVYDPNTSHYIAVGDNNLLAVSQNGTNWIYHKINATGGRTVGIQLKSVTINKDGDIYIVSDSADVFMRSHNEGSSSWVFTKVSTNVENDTLVGEPVLLEVPESLQTEVNGRTLKFIKFYIVAIKSGDKDTGIRQLMRVEYSAYPGVGDAGRYAEKVFTMKTDGTLEDIAATSSKGQDGKFYYTVTISTTNGFYEYDSRKNGIVKLNIQTNLSKRGALQAFSVPKFGIPILNSVYDPELGKVDVCVEDIDDPLMRCKSSNETMGDSGEVSSVSPTSVISEENGFKAVVSLGRPSTEEVTVIYGTVNNGIFTYNHTTRNLPVAERTCAAANDSGDVVMLGEDNKVLFSTNYGNAWRKYNM